MINYDSFRPLPFYFVNTRTPEDLTAVEIDKSMKKVKESGFGGIIFFNTPSEGFDKELYLSDFFFEVTERFILSCKKYGLEFWFMDGYSCPPGNVGDKIEKLAPQLKQQRLTRKDDGSIEPVTVSWGFPAFEEPESSRLFIELVYEEYAKHVGKYFGNGINGILSDTDNRRIDAFMLDQLHGEYYFPWSSGFSAGFEKKYGYKIEPYLNDIMDLKGGQQGIDYWNYASELYFQWHENNYQWCQSHNLKYTWHTSDTGPFTLPEVIRSSIYTEGNPFKNYVHADYPGVDHEARVLDGGTHFDQRLYRSVSTFGGDESKIRSKNFSKTKYDLRAKYVASAAKLLGKKKAMCELFAGTNLDVSTEDLCRIAAWQILQGINFLVPHAVHHRFHKHSKIHGAPPEQIVRAGVPTVRALNDFMGKYCCLISQGSWTPRVAVVDPTDKILSGEITTAKEIFELTDMLNFANIDYIILPKEDAQKYEYVFDPVADGIPAELPAPDFTFTGETLLGRINTLDSGEKVLFVGNIWSDETTAGTLTFNGRSVEIELAPGEIAVINGPFEEFRAPVVRQNVKSVALPECVKFNADNHIPFHWNASWTNAVDLPDMRLTIPCEIAEGAKFDGELLTNGEIITIFDDFYFAFTVSGKAGKHTLYIPAWDTDEEKSIDWRPCVTLANLSDFSMPARLFGNFDLELTTYNDFHHQVYAYYNLQMYYPEKMDIVLKPRTGNVAGSPFFYGKITHTMEVDGEYQNAVIELPECIGTVEVFVDGESVGEKYFRPYRFNVGKLQGKHLLEIVSDAPLTGFFEEFRASYGPQCDPVIFDA